MPYRHFTSDERDALQVFIDKELTIDCIARILKKHISSLYREITRNSQEGIYLSRYAETVAKNRRAYSKKYMAEPRISDRILGKDALRGIKELQKKGNVVSFPIATLLMKALE